MSVLQASLQRYSKALKDARKVSLSSQQQQQQQEQYCTCIAS
jgi:hypothetical protein